MNFFRKNLFGLTITAFLAFASVLSAQGFHHHESFEKQGSCSFCAWQQTGSQASSTPLPLALSFDVLIAVLLLLPTASFHFFVAFVSSGRAPPYNLL